MDTENIQFEDKVREDLIFLNVEGETRDEVLNNISGALIEKGIVKKSFAAALIKRENEYPTGIPIGKYNVAIPHTYPEHNNEIAVAIAVPKNPVHFYNMGNSEELLKVYVIICLSFEKMDDSVRLLSSLMNFFGNEENVKAIMGCRSAAEVLKVIKAGNG